MSESLTWRSCLRTALRWQRGRQGTGRDTMLLLAARD